MKVAVAVLSVDQQTPLGVFVMPVYASLLCAHALLAVLPGTLPEERATGSWERGEAKDEYSMGAHSAQY